MRIQRSWGLCVLTIIALMIGVHETRAQSYPSYPGAAPGASGYPTMPPQMQPGMAGPVAGPSFAPQSAPQMPPGVVPARAYPPMGMPPQGMVAGGMMRPGGMMPPNPMMPQGGMMRDMRVPAGGPMMPPASPYGMRPAAYYDPAQGAAPQTLGPTPAAPMGDMGMGGGYSASEGESCPYCGGGGCEMCDYNDFDLRLLRWLLPYGAGGYGAPRWYDASIEWVSLQRDSVGDSVVFATDGISGVPVLGTDQLSFSETPGFRASFAVQLGAGNVLETTYMGTFNWTSESVVTSATNDLFSIYSDFGTNPPPFGFAETDRAALQSLSYSSGLDSIELNYRQRWVSPNVRVQGSWLAGVRYLYMKEDLRYITASALNAAASDTLVSAMNSLTGAQLGGDLWVCIMPGLSIGAEAKVGLYGNHTSQQTVIQTLAVADPYVERITDNAPAFMGDANVTLLWRLNQNWTFRVGYMALWMTEVSLATDNFNPNVPLAGFATPREVIMNNSSDVFYSGLTLGFEYMW